MVVALGYAVMVEFSVDSEGNGQKWISDNNVE
jgi:hypothetical protein